MRGVSLQEISDTTKISVRFLEALEAEEFTKLPGGIFTRSFLKSYASYLGLDQDRVLSEFQMLSPSKDASDISRISTANRAQPLTPKRTPVLPWVLSVAMLAGGYLLYRYGHAPAETPATTVPLSQTSSASADEAANATPSAQIPPRANTPANDQSQGSAGQPASTAAPASSPASTLPQSNASQAATGDVTNVKAAGSEASGSQNPSGNASKNTQAVSQLQESAAAGLPKSDTASNPVLGQGDLTLQVAATERTWVAVECDGKTLLQHTLNPNEVRTLHAHDSFSVTTGNAMGLVLTFNGQTLGPLGRRGEVKTLRLTRPSSNNSQP